SAISSKMLKTHVDKFYRPQNMVISIAGKFDEEKTIEQLRKGLNGAAQEKIPPKPGVPKYRKCTIVKDKDIEQAHIALATEGLPVTDAKRYQLAILDLCLGGNMSSRLFQEVREKRGLVYTINSYKASHRNTGLFGVYAGTSPTKVAQVIDLVLAEFRRVKS